MSFIFQKQRSGFDDRIQLPYGKKITGIGFESYLDFGE